MRLKKLRIKNNITQATLAEELGVAQSTISGWENGNVQKSAEDAVRLADLFGVSVDYLLGRVDTDTSTITNDAVVDFPVITSITGGFDTPLQFHEEGEIITLPIKMLKGRPADDFFVLKVAGNSMYPRMLDGDKVLVLRRKSVDNGSTAVIMFDSNRATLKKVFCSADENFVDFVPFNPEYETRRMFENEMNSVRIVGRAVKLIRDI